MMGWMSPFQARATVVRSALFGLWLVVAPAALAAQGHGPIYGLSTPTLGEGGWSVDVGAMGRHLDRGWVAMLRPMLSYGITEDLQIYGSVPLPIEREPDAPPFRSFTRMPATRDVEVGAGWRLQRRGLDIGSRRETTLWVAIDQPLDESRPGVSAAPGGFAAVVTGYASRTIYVWVGSAYRRYLARSGSRPGDSAMASVVVGYRPPFLRRDYPSADWRGLVEVVGEWMDEDVMEGATLHDTGGRQVFVALTLLGLFGTWGIGGGPAFPLFQDVGDDGPEDRLRFAVNLTFWW